ncbi:hypothetical protein [Parvularcula maris]|uniref:DoxX family protein n=1 Tax=Parvularcula maris TaxID=2965077 RepID=A0A9X2L7E5_9PROT|nr:hypothetical protein [Parvularcula maris]MCQ8184461.1 hypothetical protein [Parvularcula maris]
MSATSITSPDQNQSSLVKKAVKLVPTGIALFTSVIFLDSLRYKFTNHENTQVIFGKLDGWAASFGAEGLFAQTGLFSQYVIGSAELVASSLLLLGILARFRRLQAVGSAVAVAVMTGAITFHLFTPLGIDPNNDGGGLFMAAVMVWVLSVVMLLLRRRELLAVITGIGRTLVPAKG